MTIPFQDFPDLERKDLVEMGGALALKEARAWMKAGAVKDLLWEKPILTGEVEMDGQTFEPELNLRSITFVQNRCTCDTGRRGLPCSHALALCLEVEKKREEAINQAIAEAEENKAKKPATDKQATTRQKQKTGNEIPRLRTIQRSKSGPPLGLWLLLPPNLENAAKRGSVPLKLELQEGNRRLPPEKLHKGQPYSFSDAVEGVLAQLESMGGGSIPGLFQLQPVLLAVMLQALRGEAAIAWVNEPSKVINWKGDSLPGVSEYLEAGLTPQEKRKTSNKNPRAAPPSVGPDESSIAFEAKEDASPPGPPSGEPAKPVEGAGRLFKPKTTRRDSRPTQPRKPATKNNIQQTTPRPGRIDIDGSEHFLSFYFSRPSEKNAFEWIETLKAEGFRVEPSNGKYWLRDRHRTLNFLGRHLEDLQADPAVQFSKNFLQRTAHLKIARFRTRAEKNARNAFDLSLQLEAGNTASADLQRALRSNQNFIPDGEQIWLLNPDRIERAAKLQQNLTGQPERVLTANFKTRLQSPLLPLASDLIEDFDPDFQPPQTWQARSSALRHIDRLEPIPLPHALERTLRPYQKIGAAWLWHLHRNQLGGILADEMGLGKTLQAIALISSSLSSSPSPSPSPLSNPNQPPKNDKPATVLVVCPASLVENWRREFRKFAPDLQVYPHHGPNRLKNPEGFEDYDVLVTSYGTLVRDQALLQSRSFAIVLADEAQHVKNRRTQASKALRSLSANGRFILTGTPIENAVDDLRSLFAFLMPGYLTAIPPGSNRDDRQWFDQRHLAQTAPYILRRTKAAVAPELPKKLEQVVYCEMPAPQRSFYEKMRSDTEKQIFEMEMAGAGDAKIKFAALRQLLRLRQVCADPRVLDPDFKPDHSAKLAAFREILEEALDGGHRLLVFSQFTSVLKLLIQSTDAWELPSLYLDGSTRNRQDLVERFNGDPSIPVFFISLMAGGVGLNLTGADTVVHFDPWWNPAVEAQATDRAHRIGQEKVVTSYKFIAADTVEEKVLDIQKTKAALLQELFEQSEAGAARISLADLKEMIGK